MDGLIICIIVIYVSVLVLGIRAAVETYLLVRRRNTPIQVEMEQETKSGLGRYPRHNAPQAR